MNCARQGNRVRRDMEIGKFTVGGDAAIYMYEVYEVEQCPVVPDRPLVNG